MRSMQPGNGADGDLLAEGVRDAFISIAVRREDGRGIVKIRGELDLYARDLLATRIAALFREDRPAGIEIHAGQVSFMDAAGLSSLLALRASVTALGIDFRVATASRQFARVTHLAGVTEALAAPMAWE